jgi:hypothetical protein
LANTGKRHLKLYAVGILPADEVEHTHRFALLELFGSRPWQWPNRTDVLRNKVRPVRAIAIASLVRKTQIIKAVLPALPPLKHMIDRTIIFRTKYPADPTVRTVPPQNAR